MGVGGRPEYIAQKRGEVVTTPVREWEVKYLEEGGGVFGRIVHGGFSTY